MDTCIYNKISVQVPLQCFFLIVFITYLNSKSKIYVKMH